MSKSDFVFVITHPKEGPKVDMGFTAGLFKTILIKS